MASDLTSRLFSVLQDLSDANNVTRNTLVLGFVVCFVVYWWMTKRKYRLPPGPTGLPILGYLPYLGKEPYKVFKKLSDKYGNVFGLHLGRTYAVVLGDYEAVKEGLTLTETLARPPTQFDFLPDGGGFSTSNSTEWTEQRRFAVRAMRDIGLGGSKWESMILEEIEEFRKLIEDQKGQPLNCARYLNESISNNITTLIIGRRIPFGDPIRQLVDRTVDLALQLSEVSSLRNFFPLVSDIMSKFGLGGTSPDFIAKFQEFSSFIKEEVKARKKIRETEDANTFIDGYLTEIENNMKDRLNNTFNERNLRGNTLTLIVAGSDTTAAAVGWLFISMALFPEIQKKVHEELDRVIGKDGQAKYTERSKLPYCYAVQQECERWMPIVPLSPVRIALEDIKIGGYDVPKNSMIISNFWAIHKSPKYWKEPEKFVPERFLTDKVQIIESKIDGYVPFSIGKRNCPGESMAKITIFLYFTAIMQKFEILSPVGQKPKLETRPGLTFRPVAQELRFVPRD